MSASKKPLYENLVDMTAMVNIVFFVLIFFMVTSMQKTFTAIEMPSPQQDRDRARSAPARRPTSSGTAS